MQDYGYGEDEGPLSPGWRDVLVEKKAQRLRNYCLTPAAIRHRAASMIQVRFEQYLQAVYLQLLHLVLVSLSRG